MNNFCTNNIKKLNFPVREGAYLEFPIPNSQPPKSICAYAIDMDKYNRDTGDNVEQVNIAVPFKSKLPGTREKDIAVLAFPELKRGERISTNTPDNFITIWSSNQQAFIYDQYTDKQTLWEIPNNERLINFEVINGAFTLVRDKSVYSINPDSHSIQKIYTINNQEKTHKIKRAFNSDRLYLFSDDEFQVLDGIGTDSLSTKQYNTKNLGLGKILSIEDSIHDNLQVIYFEKSLGIILRDSQDFISLPLEDLYLPTSTDTKLLLVKKHQCARGQTHRYRVQQGEKENKIILANFQLDAVTGKLIDSFSIYDPLKKTLNKLGINDLDRFSSREFVKEIIQNRQELLAGRYSELNTKPLYIVFAAADDHNGSLSSNDLDILRHTHNVLYFEASTVQELEQYHELLFEAINNGLNKPPEYNIAAHANPRLMGLGKKKLYSPTNMTELRTNNLIRLKPYSDIYSEANVLLAGCSTGGGEGKSFAQSFQESLSPLSTVGAEHNILGYQTSLGQNNTVNYSMYDERNSFMGVCSPLIEEDIYTATRTNSN